MGNTLRKCFFNYNNDNNYDEYSRDSFSHRICDDLCEVVLQFLSLEDKIRFECVSQQFQRTVFQRQNEMRFDDPTCNIFKKTRIESFKKLLKKCPNITSVYISNTIRYLNYIPTIGCVTKPSPHELWYSNSITDEFGQRGYGHNDCIEIITRNCHSLTKFKYKFCGIDKAVFEKFIETFGESLKYFACSIVPSSQILKKLKNIETLDLYCCDFDGIQDHKFFKLKTLTAHIYDENEQNLLEFIKNNTGIQKLSVQPYRTDFYYINKIYKELSKHKNMIDITIDEVSIKFWSDFFAFDQDEYQ